MGFIQSYLYDWIEYQRHLSYQSIGVESIPRRTPHFIFGFFNSGIFVFFHLLTFCNITETLRKH